MNDAAETGRAQWRFEFFFVRQGQTHLWDYVKNHEAQPDAAPGPAGRDRWARLSPDEGDVTERACWIHAFVSIPEDDDPEDWEPIAFELARQCLGNERGGHVPD